jgi:hypothetical protein
VKRKHERQVAQNAIRFVEAVCFSMATLKDKSLLDAVARKTALDALQIGWSA